jgi:hypothetical protein
MASLFGSNWDDPKTIAMMQAAAALMQAGGPSRTPVSFGQGVGQAYNAGLQGYQGQQELLAKQKAQEAQQAMADIQLRQLRQQMLQQQEAQDYLKNLQSANSYTGPMAGLPKDKNNAMLTSMINTGNPVLIAQAKTMAETNKLLQPKWSTNPTNLMRDGQAVATLVNDEGMTKEIGTPAEKLVEQNLGGTSRFVSPFTGIPVAGTNAAKTPSIGDALAMQRFAWDQSQASKPQFKDGAWITPPTAANPQGSSTSVPGFSPPMTEAQANANIFSTRANEANRVITELEGKFSPMGIAVKQSMPGVLTPLANSMLSADTQKAEQAQRDFVNAVLRKESGAAISESEFENARKQYFPQPGDSKEVQQQKYENRVREVEGLKAAVGKNANFEVFRKPSDKGNVAPLKFLGFE